MTSGNMTCCMPKALALPKPDVSKVKRTGTVLGKAEEIGFNSAFGHVSAQQSSPCRLEEEHCERSLSQVDLRGRVERLRQVRVSCKRFALCGVS